MKSLQCHSFDLVNGLQIVESADPEPGPNEVIINVRAVNVAYVDRLIVTGKYQVVPKLPYTPGGMCAGDITAVGVDVRDRAVGDRVVTRCAGAWATKVTVAAASTVPIPDRLSDVGAAAGLEAYGTAIYALENRITAEAGKRMLVLGAGGAVGAACVEIAADLGLHVVAVTSQPEAITGAELVIDRRTDDMRAVMKATYPDGVDYVIDPVGGDLAPLALRSLGFRGKYLVVGFASGMIPQLPANHTLLKEREIVGVDWGDYVRERPGAAEESLSGVVARLGQRSVSVPSANELNFEQLKDALQKPPPASGLVRTVLVP
ncbi:NADPH2:quinone reductase [Antricoccus suffuscus]|uniref:NADPH2:quinone reductase n=1 Tax=Antricoccus suffuscus TaxID=1629062 RepID=A0A2T1A6A0_9ACTN|nr:zinc-binding dehydrogenase [Antricoccus suffuscus]PRZ44116.1 NADPH2:quinone reductase [Antricoccus suffuscus]